MRRLVAAIIAIALTACACSSVTSGVGARLAGGPTDGTSPGTSTGAAPSLDSQLLTLHDLPAGWQVDNTPDTSAGAPPCLSRASSSIPGTHTTTAGFTAAAGLPALFEILSQFGTRDNARSAFTQFQTLLDGCSSFDLPTTGTPLHATLVHVALPRLGDQSTTWRLIVGSDTAPEGSGAFLLARRGTELVLMLYANLGASDVHEIVPFARTAIAKMPS